MTQAVRFQNMEHYGFGPNVMKKNKVCKKCGKLVVANMKSCPECGERLPRETLFDSYKQRHKCCSHCDTVLPSNSMYCPHCGKKIV